MRGGFFVHLSLAPATLEHAFELRLGGPRVTSTIATHSKDATPQWWEAATLEDLLEASAACGVQAGALYRAINHLARVHAERVGEA